MNYIQWANDAIKQGPPPMNIDSPLTTWDDYTLATQHQYHIDQIKRSRFSLETLKIWPEYRSELFNEDLINADIDFHGEELTAINQEISRRIIR